MTARTAMVHRTTIQRDASMASSVVKDEWGGDQAPAWTPTSSVEVSCRYWYDDSATIMDGERRILSTARYVQLPIDTDVTDDDRIGDITDRAGRLLCRGPMRIDSIGPHERDHLVAKLVEIT